MSKQGSSEPEDGALTRRTRSVGFISGPSPATTVKYWEELHAAVRRKRGFENTVAMRWENLASEQTAHAGVGSNPSAPAAAEAARRLEASGVDTLVLCSNALHLLAQDVSAAVKIPIRHIATAVASKLDRLRLRAPILLGTTATETEMWDSALRAQGIAQVFAPCAFDRDYIHGLTVSEATEDPDRLREIRAALVNTEAGLRREGGTVVVVTTPLLIPFLSDDPQVLPRVCAIRIHCEDIVSELIGA